MITYIRGNLFDSKADIYVNTVNCVGVMGRGIALEFKNRYPKMFMAYNQECMKNRITTGKMWQWNEEKNIICFPTKQHWKNISNLRWIDEGLTDLRKLLEKFPQQSVAIPALGCANGGLQWVDVRPLIEKHLGRLHRDIEVYVPDRLIVHCKREPYDVYIGRPELFGNPFVIGQDGTREEVIQKYREWVVDQKKVMNALPDLLGKVLGCWCSPNPCHGDVLLDLAYGVESCSKKTITC